MEISKVCLGLILQIQSGYVGVKFYQPVFSFKMILRHPSLEWKSKLMSAMYVLRLITNSLFTARLVG